MQFFTAGSSPSWNNVSGIVTKKYELFERRHGFKIAYGIHYLNIWKQRQIGIMGPMTALLFTTHYRSRKGELWQSYRIQTDRRQTTVCVIGGNRWIFAATLLGNLTNGTDIKQTLTKILIKYKRFKDVLISANTLEMWEITSKTSWTTYACIFRVDEM